MVRKSVQDVLPVGVPPGGVIVVSGSSVSCVQHKKMDRPHLFFSEFPREMLGF